MTSLTTLFVVGPEEYVEFNESMGSKAFLEHVWDQSQTPLKAEDTSASGTQLHSAGARISPNPPPRIEFPTVLRLRGRGNRYQATGKYISWEELKRRNPLALRDPPSLDEFVAKGSKVGEAERLEPGAMLRGERRFKITKRPKGTVEVFQDSDGWLGGGSSESVYAETGSKDSIYASHDPPHATLSVTSKFSSTDTSTDLSSFDNKLTTPEQTAPARSLRKSRSGLSLSARLGMDESSAKDIVVPPLPDPVGAKQERDLNVKDQKKLSKPSHITMPVENGSTSSSLPTPFAKTPLSASHSPPETPMKRFGITNQMEIPVTPMTEERVTQQLQIQSSNDHSLSGLLLDHGQGSSQTVLSDRHTAEKPANKATMSTPIRAARSQIDEMLARLRSARSGLSGGDTSESMWAPKKPDTDSSTAEKAVATSSTSKHTTPTAPSHPTKAAKAANPAQDAGNDASKAPKSDTPAGTKSNGNSKSEEVKGSAKGASKESQPVESKASNQKSLLDRLGPTTKTDERKSKNGDEKQAKKGNATREADAPKKEIPKVAQTTSAKDLDSKLEKDERSSVEKPIEAKPAVADVREETLDAKEETPDAKEETPDAKEETPAPAHADDDTKSVADNISHFGNETLTSINWADDDDDESLPDLPDDWAKPLSPKVNSDPAAKGRSFSFTSSSGVASVGNASSDAGDSLMSPSRAHFNSDDRRGSRRDRKSRGSAKSRRDKSDPKGNGVDSNAKSSGSSGVPTTSKDNLGLRIAGRASSSSNAKQESQSSFVPYWERKKAPDSNQTDKTSIPSAPRGMRIAGSAHTAAAGQTSAARPGHDHADRRGQKAPRELFPSAAPKERGEGRPRGTAKGDSTASRQTKNAATGATKEKGENATGGRRGGAARNGPRSSHAKQAQ